MNTILNPSFLRQTQFDSAAPAGTGVVVHQFHEEGEFHLAVARGDELLRRVRVNVGGRGDASKARPTDRPHAPQAGAASLDVTKLLLGGTEHPEVGDLSRGGYLSITSSRPMPDHHIVVHGRDGGEGVLDTRRLGSRSLFAVTLVRPGRYALRNAITGAEATVVVTYPQVGDTPYRPPDPLEIQCGEQGFEASTFTISPAQGIVFRFAVESRIQLELVEPDDGPNGGKSPPVASFRRPRRPDGGTA
jgi:hypothetical protein